MARPIAGRNARMRQLGPSPDSGLVGPGPRLADQVAHRNVRCPLTQPAASA